jgi:hypothetical protein
VLVCACSVYETSPNADSAHAAGAAGEDGGHVAGAGAGNGAAPSSAGTSSGGDAAAAGTPGESGAPGEGGSPEASHAGSTNGGASSDAGTSPGTGGASGAGGSANPTRVLELLDDMEDSDAFVVASKGRNGHWDVSNDASSGATQTPLAAAFSMAELTDAARPDSHFAAYTQGVGFKDWGAYMTVSMRTWPKYEETPVYDASAYSGISFYAKVGAGSDATLRVRYIGAQTDPRGGQCTVGGSVDAACYDHFFASIKLSQDWQRVELLFADFQQAGVGKTFPKIDLTGMYALDFFFPGRKTTSGNAFELWVDDLSFIVK